MATFEFIVKGPAVSLKAKKTNAKRYQKWIRTVRAAAHLQWPIGKKPTNSEDVIVSITNYYTLAPPDVDNIIKPILDALHPIVYLDDRQVRKVTSQKRDLSSPARISDPSATLATALDDYTELLHIIVTWEAEG